MATRDDVARLAGVSPSTVSYVISGRRTISEATRARVRSAMRELDYTPNAFAQGLAGARGGLLALHYPWSPHGFNSSEFEYVSAATEQARRHGHHLLLWSNPIDDLDGLRGLLRQRLVDGVVLMELLPSDPRVEVVRDSAVPFTMIGRPDEDAGLTYVDLDFDAMARIAVDHVADLGHRDVVFLAPPAKPPGRGAGPLARIHSAFELPARRRGVRLRRLEVDNTFRGGHDAFAAVRAHSPRPTAILTFDELIPLGVLNAAAAAQVQTPEELTIVALTIADATAETVVPALTTVSPPAATIAATAVDDLIELVGNPSAEVRQSLVVPVLTVRASSAPAG